MKLIKKISIALSVLALQACTTTPVFYSYTPEWATSIWIEGGKVWARPRSNVEIIRVQDGAGRNIQHTIDGAYFSAEKSAVLKVVYTTPENSGVTVFTGDSFADWPTKIPQRFAAR